MSFQKYDELKADPLWSDDVSELDRLLLLLRGLTTQFATLVRAANPAETQLALTRIDPLLAEFGPDDDLPNLSALAGARKLTKAQFDQLRTLATTVLTLYQDNLELLIDAGGTENVS